MLLREIVRFIQQGNTFFHRQAVNTSSKDYPICSPSNMTAITAAQEAYSSYLRTAVLVSSASPDKEEAKGANTTSACELPCQSSLIRLNKYAESYFLANEDKFVVLRMPTIIQLTESSLSYSFIDFVSEFGGNGFL
jgi:hypothetical protein